MHGMIHCLLYLGSDSMDGTAENVNGICLLNIMLSRFVKTSYMSRVQPTVFEFGDLFVHG